MKWHRFMDCLVQITRFYPLVLHLTTYFNIILWIQRIIIYRTLRKYNRTIHAQEDIETGHWDRKPSWRNTDIAIEGQEEICTWEMSLI